jgi:hypothetical protein
MLLLELALAPDIWLNSLMSGMMCRMELVRVEGTVPAGQEQKSARQQRLNDRQPAVMGRMPAVTVV